MLDGHEHEISKQHFILSLRLLRLDFRRVKKQSLHLMCHPSGPREKHLWEETCVQRLIVLKHPQEAGSRTLHGIQNSTHSMHHF